jgi:hypothetical protein
MRRVEHEKLSVAEANDRLGVDMEPGFWEALVGLISYPELVWEPATESLCYPNYVPFEELAKEWLDGIESGMYDVRQCARCVGYFDVNQTPGIFGRPEELEEFICMGCAEAMTAREYYEKFIERT